MGEKATNCSKIASTVAVKILSPSEPFLRPHIALKTCLEQLRLKGWQENIHGLEAFVRLMRHHRDLIEEEMSNVCCNFALCVSNQRSQVTHAACRAAPGLFAVKSKILEYECSALVDALLNRTADTNKFIRDDVDLVMRSMVEHFSTPKLLEIITNKAAKHQNPIVRTAGAKLLLGLAERLGVQRIYAMKPETRNKFFLNGANFLQEGHSETRELSKALFLLLAKSDKYKQVLPQSIPNPQFLSLEKVLTNIK